jgi:hypothetical protein
MALEISDVVEEVMTVNITYYYRFFEVHEYADPDSLIKTILCSLMNWKRLLSHAQHPILEAIEHPLSAR